MTYFSRFEINPQRREAKKLLTNPQALHASVLALFPPSIQAPDRVLWRLDSEHPQHILYVVSPEKPDFAHLAESVGWQTSPGQTLDYTRFLQQVQTGSEWLFRLQANPTKALYNETLNKAGHRGKVIPLVKEEQQLEWLIAKAPRSGFVITERPNPDKSDLLITELQVLENREQVFFKNEPDNDHSEDIRRKVTLRKVVFEGKLVVTDELEFRKTLINGLGRAKSYGNGLITLKR